MSRVSSTKIPPVFLRPGFALVVLVQCIVYCYISLPKKKSIGHTLQGRYSLIPTSSASVEILYLTFAPTFFCATLHAPWIWPLQCDLSCCCGSRKLHQSMYIHIQGSFLQWFFCNQWFPLTITALSSVFSVVHIVIWYSLAWEWYCFFQISY